MKINLSYFTPRRTTRRRRRRRTIITTRRRTRKILPMFDATLVMKKDTLQETVPSGKRGTAHIAEDDEPTNKRFKREKDDSDEEYVLTTTLTSTISHEEQ